jgi:hypothetical protein
MKITAPLFTVKNIIPSNSNKGAFGSVHQGISTGHKVPLQQRRKQHVNKYMVGNTTIITQHYM